MEQSFLDGAGFNASDVSVLIRVMIASLYTLFVAWLSWKQFALVREERMEVGKWFNNVVWQISLLVGVLLIVII